MNGFHKKVYKTQATDAPSVKSDQINSAGLSGAGSALSQFFALGTDLQTVGLNGKAKSAADFSFQLLQLLAFELDDFVAVLANDVVVMRVFGVIWIIKLIILAEIHFTDQAAFGQEGKCSIDCRTRNRFITVP